MTSGHRVSDNIHCITLITVTRNFFTGSMLPLRSMRPTQPEYGSADLYLQGSPESKAKETAQKSGNLPRVVLWTRLPGIVSCQ